MGTFELLFRDSGDHQILRPPQRADASRLFRHSRIEFELIGVYPRIGGVSGTESINCVILLLKVSMLFISLSLSYISKIFFTMQCELCEFQKCHVVR